ncbi:putative P74-like protein [Mamestra configurata nucleopolyhedrovirus A]|uniref:p74 n=2 Tax=Mamestra configurata nucleopolyhedrovirus TaxID=207830 RepID=Q8QL74_NPVMC|nr:p74 [Mamestra configurata nucleopolyhedrovirus A]UVZ34995.1 P74 [Melanchra picta nucleopolyhedrovirus]AAM09268.1 p74 [Mamestra configurata nucleopolyhedrovirus A]AAQ11179.1 putative P74-like protein [Mamestra configurata nucleopolyhedrovirus A]QEE80046.1 pif-0/p74 [Mamestra configurata nucleopolyhedrovirus A]QNH90640.1 pif-0/p74 [Mamestra configurata nucleopolyhedrovirus A]
MTAPPVTVLTFVDYMNVDLYCSNLWRLRRIYKWRTKLPHILIDYEIREAGFDDYYIPSAVANRALHVKWTFSKKGCESMSCYPYNEFGPIEISTPANYTQTSETAVLFGQPACYNLDRAAATREGSEQEIQAPELRYTDDRKCILVDTMTKMYLNSPYIRTDEHVIMGIDDVPAFNVAASNNPLLPEQFLGTFNDAYCRRFGRSLQNGGCHLQWWESLIGFVLGDTIYITMKMLANNVFSELRSFDYRNPSSVLPQRPFVNSSQLLRDWQQTRDPAADIDFEKLFVNYCSYDDLDLHDGEKIVYRAEEGLSRVPIPKRKLEFRIAVAPATSTLRDTNSPYYTDLDFVISQFLEDNALIMGIAASFGFDFLFDNLKLMLKRINTTLIPTLKRILYNTTERVTVRLLGESYKAFVAQTFNRIAIKTISAVAKAMTRIAIKAASVIGIILIIMSIADLILGLWDPLGYNNMFPREFPDDLSLSFLSAYFDSITGGTRDLIEFIPEFFDDLIEEDSETIDLVTGRDGLEYIASLEVNSNGQRLDLSQGDVIDDFDEATLVGNALASSALYTYLDFLQYTERHNKILFSGHHSSMVVPVMFIMGALILMLMPQQDTNIVALFIIFILIALYLMIDESLHYYMGLRAYTHRIQDRWYDNLYTE